MRKLYFLFVCVFFVAFAVESFAQTNTLYLGVTKVKRQYEAPYAATPPVIDGNVNDAIWATAQWAQAQTVSIITTDWTAAANIGTPAGPEGAFSGAGDASFKYKIVWDNKRYYLLLRYTDDVDIYSDLHSGYPGPAIIPPPFNSSWVQPAIGAGTGTNGYTHWRMDQIALWIAPYQASFLTSYNRSTSGGPNHNFYIGAVKSTQPGAVIWSDKSNVGATHKATVAGKYNSTEGAYYIEFKDTLWENTFFGTQAGYIPHAGDSLLFNGEINDADGTSNRRDYSLLLSVETGNGGTSLAQAMRIKLVNATTSVPSIISKNEFNFYPNPNSTGILRLSKITDVEIFNLEGQQIMKSARSSEVNISALKSGVYMVKDLEGNVRKLIIK
jgi:hypothetical protein